MLNVMVYMVKPLVVRGTLFLWHGLVYGKVNYSPAGPMVVLMVEGKETR